MKQDYQNFGTFAIACVIDTTDNLRKAKEQLIQSVVEDNGPAIIGPNMVSAFVHDHGLLEAGEGGVPLDDIRYMELAEEWTQELLGRLPSPRVG